MILWESDIELDPIFVRYRPAKSFKPFALAAKLDHASHGLPRIYKQAVTGPEATQWIPSMEEGRQQLMDKRSLNLVLRANLKDQKILLGRWVFRKKVKDDGTVLYKSRWVVPSDMMRDFSGDGYETYSPVVDATTTRILSATAAHNGWTILQADAGFPKRSLTSKLDSKKAKRGP
jgi:Reverse transcriptase (RNA-dependent DNA polymerase)